MEYWEEQQLKQSGYFEEAPKPTSPDPKAGVGALETTLENVKKTLWDIERHTSDTQSRLDKNNQSGPSHYAQKISRWAAEPWGLDIMNETLPEIRDAIEDLGASKDNFLTRGLESIKDILSNSAIARKSASPLEESLAVIHESSVYFNEKTMRWHDEESNLMVKGDDERVQAEKFKAVPSAVEAEIHWPSTIASFLEEISDACEEILHGMKLVVHKLYNPEKEKEEKDENKAEKKEKGKSEETKMEGKVAAKKGAKNEKKQTTILGGMWNELKKDAEKSWFAENWKLIAGGLFFLFAPLKWIKGIWEFVSGPLWEFFKAHPLITILGGLATWFLGGAFLSSLATSVVSAIGSGLTAIFGTLGGGVGILKTLMIGVKSFGAGGLASPLAIIAAVVSALFDGIMGFFSAGDWGVSKIGGFLGGMFAGQKGWVGMFTNMGKWAVAGAILGAPFFGIGAIPGGLVGAAIGAIFNFIGGKRMAQAFDNVLGIFKELLLLPIKLAKFLFKWIIVKPFSWLFKKIASTDIWKSMVASWSKGWNELVSDLTEVWDSFTWIFREAGKQLGQLWDWLMDPKNIISGDLIMGLVDPIIQWFKDLFNFEMPDWDIGAGIKDAVKSMISGIPGFLVPDSIEEWANAKGEEPTVESKKQEQRDIIKEEEEKIKKSQLHMAGGGEDVYGPSLDNVLGLEIVGQRQSLEAIEEATKALLKIGVDDRKSRIATAEKIASKTGKMSQGEYWKSEQGIADRTDVDNNLIGMNKEEQAQLYEEYVGIGDTPKAGQIPSTSAPMSMGEAYAQGMTKKSVNKNLTLMRKGPKGNLGGRGYRRKIKIALDPLKSPNAKPLWDAMEPEEQKQWKHLDPYKMEKDRRGKFVGTMRTSMPGTSSSSYTATTGLTGNADKKMQTFNSIQEKNRTLQEGKSGAAVIVSNQNKTINSQGGNINTLYPKPIHAPRLRESNRTASDDF